MEPNPMIRQRKRRETPTPSTNGDTAHAPTILFPNGGKSAEGKSPESDITEKDVARLVDLKRISKGIRSLWKGWIQIGVLTLIAGVGMAGKTRFCGDLIRRIRKGLPWPDGQPMEADPEVRVMWIMSDNNHDEIVSLADEFGITETIWLNAKTPSKENPTSPYEGIYLEGDRDFHFLEKRIAAAKIQIVIIDTVGSCCATNRDMSLQGDAQSFFGPLQKIARNQNCVVICLTHVSASGHALGRRAREKVRIEIRLSQPDPLNPRRRLWVDKSNSVLPPALGVKMMGHGNEYDTSPPTAPDAGTENSNSKRMTECMGWLIEQLQSGPRRVSELRSEWEERGFSSKTIYAARKLLKITESKQGKFVIWELDTEDEPEPPEG